MLGKGCCFLSFSHISSGDTFHRHSTPPCYLSTDSAFVGHIHDGQNTPETYLAAAVLSDMVVNVLMVPPLAFNQVLNALVGQAIGSNNPKMAGIWLQQSMFWLSLTMLPCLVGCFYVEPILRLLDFPEEVAAVAGTYAKYNVVWPIPNGLYQCMRFYFQAQGLPKPAMYNNLLFLFVNAALNWCFVFGGPFRYLCGWTGFGFVGAAISLSISRTAQSVCYFLYMFVYKRHHLRTWPGLGWRQHNKARTIEFLKQSVPNMVSVGFSDRSPRPLHGSKPENLEVSWWLLLPSATRPSQTSSLCASSHISFPQPLDFVSILLHAGDSTFSAMC